MHSSFLTSPYPSVSFCDRLPQATAIMCDVHMVNACQFASFHQACDRDGPGGRGHQVNLLLGLDKTANSKINFNFKKVEMRRMIKHLPLFHP